MRQSSRCQAVLFLLCRAFLKPIVSLCFAMSCFQAEINKWIVFNKYSHCCFCFIRCITTQCDIETINGGDWSTPHSSRPRADESLGKRGWTHKLLLAVNLAPCMHFSMFSHGPLFDHKSPPSSPVTEIAVFHISNCWLCLKLACFKDTMLLHLPKCWPTMNFDPWH